MPAWPPGDRVLLQRTAPCCCVAGPEFDLRLPEGRQPRLEACPQQDGSRRLRCDPHKRCGERQAARGPQPASSRAASTCPRGGALSPAPAAPAGGQSRQVHHHVQAHWAQASAGSARPFRGHALLFSPLALVSSPTRLHGRPVAAAMPCRCPAPGFSISRRTRGHAPLPMPTRPAWRLQGGRER